LFKRLNNFSWIWGLDTQGIDKLLISLILIIPASPREPTTMEVNLLARFRKEKYKVAEIISELILSLLTK